MISLINLYQTKLNSSITSTLIFGLILFSCNSNTIHKLENIQNAEFPVSADSITFHELFGKWTLKIPNRNAPYSTFIIDSNGFHNLTDSSLNTYKLKVDAEMFIIVIDSTESKNLITYHSHDTLTIYWTSGLHETYIRTSKLTRE